MIETKEEYQQIIDTMPVHCIGKAMYLTEVIEALREVARAGRAYANAVDYTDPVGSAQWVELDDALDALPDWITDG